MLEAWRERCWTLTENGWEYLDDAPRLLSSYEERVMGAKLVADGLRGPNTNALQAIFRRTVG